VRGTLTVSPPAFFDEGKLATRPVTLTHGQKMKLLDFQTNLQDVPPTVGFYSLWGFQSKVGNQNPRGACATFAFLGAIEARYKRDLGFDIHLSEEYFIHYVFSTQPTYTPSLLHENWCSGFGFPGDQQDMSPAFIDGADLMAAEGFLIPESQFCPYFGDMNPTLSAYGTLHAQSDLEQIALDSNLEWRPISFPDPSVVQPVAPVRPRTQTAVDDYEYDPRHISLDARRYAFFGVTGIHHLDDPKDTAMLEKCIYNNFEVVVGITLDNLNVGDGKVYPDNITPVPWLRINAHGILPVLAPVARYGVDDANKGAQGDHAMLMVGFWRNPFGDGKNYFLLKNSWGDSYNSWPYLWVPYNYIIERCTRTTIVEDVVKDRGTYGGEPLWFGKWNIDIDGTRGKLVLRHTRAAGQPAGTIARLGTYYSPDDVPHEVWGFTSHTEAYLYIDKEHEGPPNTAGYVADYVKNIPTSHRSVYLQMFGEASGRPGDYAAGAEYTVRSDGMQSDFGDGVGVLLSRADNPPPYPLMNMDYIPGSFDPTRWVGWFLVYRNDSDSTWTTHVLHIAGLQGFQAHGEYDGIQCWPNIGPAPHILTFGMGGPFRYANALSPFLFYHRNEVNLASGVGVFAESFSYIGNNKTKEIHLPDCEWISKAKYYHKTYFRTIDEALGYGYEGCNYCLPEYEKPD
jgi:hypothetical protein